MEEETRELSLSGQAASGWWVAVCQVPYHPSPRHAGVVQCNAALAWPNITVMQNYTNIYYNVLNREDALALVHCGRQKHAVNVIQTLTSCVRWYGLEAFESRYLTCKLVTLNMFYYPI